MKKTKGFTLIELLVAIAIIGTLGTISVYALTSARNKAKLEKAKADIEQIRKAIEMLANDTSEWPGHQPINTVCTDIVGGCPANNEICGPDADSNDCLSGLTDASSGIIEDDSVTNFSGWFGPYMNSIPLDPWGHEYFFDTDYEITFDGEPCNSGAGCFNAVVVGSYGPDGNGLNDYNADDVIEIIIR